VAISVGLTLFLVRVATVVVTLRFVGLKIRPGFLFPIRGLMTGVKVLLGLEKEIRPLERDDLSPSVSSSWSPKPEASSLSSSSPAPSPEVRTSSSSISRKLFVGWMGELISGVTVDPPGADEMIVSTANWLESNSGVGEIVDAATPTEVERIVSTTVVSPS
jgi:hypothetical protein